MAPATGSAPALILDLDETLVPLATLSRWQWAWRPNGPVLPERHAVAAIRHSLRAWDRRRWRGLTGAEPAVRLDDYRGQVEATFLSIADRPLPPTEINSVVDRFLKPVGPITPYPDVAPFLRSVEASGGQFVVTSALPTEVGAAFLARVGIGRDHLVEIPSGGLPPPDRTAYRAAAERLTVRPRDAVFLGDLYWSDVRAAARVGLRSILLDREGRVPPASGERIRTLAELPEILARPPPLPPEIEPADTGPSDGASP